MKIRALLGMLALCVVGADVATCAITDVRVTGVTSTQAVIACTAPNLSACTVEVYDGSGYRFAGLRVTAATNAPPIGITTDAQHTLATGDKVYITGVGGNTAATEQRPRVFHVESQPRPTLRHHSGDRPLRDPPRRRPLCGGS